MATVASPADCWSKAVKCREILHEKLARLRRNEGKGKEDSDLEEVDAALQSLRLNCMSTVFTDFEYAIEQNAENILWQAHATINSEYRKILARVDSKHQPNYKAVLHHKVEKLYVRFLRTSQGFYKGYVQRLSARYQIPELERVAGRMRSEGVSLNEVSREKDPRLAPKILKSCHATLLHLGDLSRYRRYADRKTHGFEAPLVYYRLAHEILPTSGHGHHQMAVVYIAEKDQHLQIVYHLYRALAVQEPHPMALKNLELEFKKLLPGSPPRAGHSAPDPQVTLATWFVRLHAIFYRGEASTSQQGELEREVLHRTRILCTSKGSNQLLFDVVLTNMAAYYLARQRAEESWTFPVSRSFKYILDFNIRTILAISRALGTEIREALKSAAAPQAGGTTRAADNSSEKVQATHEISDQQSQRFLTVLDTAIPLLRLYMVWLCMHRGDMVMYGSRLSPAASEMHKSLSNTLSVIIELFLDGALQTGTCNYMFPEDADTVCFEPLNKVDVAPVCRAMHFTADGKKKPRLDDGAGVEQLPSSIETLARIHDIINCAYFLGTDPRYPLRVTQLQGGSKAMTVLTYVEPDEAEAPSSPSNATPPVPSTPNNRTSRAGSTANIPKEIPEARIKPRIATYGSREKPTAQADTNESAEADYGVDGETLNRVNEFLTPPEVHSPQSAAAAPDESSYGMNTTTANEVFAALNANAAPTVTTPTSATGKAFPALPWDLIYTPTPYRSGADPDSAAAAAFAHPQARNHCGPGPVAPAATGTAAGTAAAGSPLDRKHANSLSGVMTQGSPEQRLDYPAPGPHLPIQDLAMGETYDKALLDELAKATTWSTDPRRLPVSSVSAAATQQSDYLRSLASGMPGSTHGAPSSKPMPPPPPSVRRHPPPNDFMEPYPFFQSSNFSQGNMMSSLPQMGSSFNAHAGAAVRPVVGGGGAVVDSWRFVPGMSPASPQSTAFARAVSSSPTQQQQQQQSAAAAARMNNRSFSNSNSNDAATWSAAGAAWKQQGRTAP